MGKAWEIIKQNQKWWFDVVCPLLCLITGIPWEYEQYRFWCPAAILRCPACIKNWYVPCPTVEKDIQQTWVWNPKQLRSETPGRFGRNVPGTLLQIALQRNNSFPGIQALQSDIRRPRQTQGGARQGIILLTLVSDYYRSRRSSSSRRSKAKTSKFSRTSSRSSSSSNNTFDSCFGLLPQQAQQQQEK